MNEYITVIGGGLAGSEAAYQIAKRGIKVKLYEMKPQKFSGAHENKNLAEIVCSNSFKSNSITNACGLLKEELRRLGSLLIECADKTSIPAGQALAVDRESFSQIVTKELESNPNIEIIREEITKIPEGIVIIATGPLTSEDFSKEISKLINEEYLHFYDAASPIVTKESIDMSIAFMADRYGKCESDYINLPMTEEEYNTFYENLVTAETVQRKTFEKNDLFEGCMPVEEMARRGKHTLTYGNLKPVGFIDPRTGKRPYAVVQLRQDNKEGTIYNLVGFQTNLKFGEQKRVFSLIPGLKNAEFVRYGVMHRNTYINSTKLLDETYNMKENKSIFFAGQITGVEGYVESISSGYLAGINAVNMYEGKEKTKFPEETMIGSLAKYISTESKDFQPMNANFGIIKPLDEKIKDKQKKYEIYAQRALSHII